MSDFGQTENHSVEYRGESFPRQRDAVLAVREKLMLAGCASAWRNFDTEADIFCVRMGGEMAVRDLVEEKI